MYSSSVFLSLVIICFQKKEFLPVFSSHAAIKCFLMEIASRLFRIFSFMIFFTKLYPYVKMANCLIKPKRIERFLLMFCNNVWHFIVLLFSPREEMLTDANEMTIMSKNFYSMKNEYVAFFLNIFIRREIFYC